MNPRILLILVVLLIVGSYALGIFNFLSISSAKTEMTKVTESVKKLTDSVGILTASVAKASSGADAAMTVAFKAAAAPRNMTSMDLMEFRTFHPEIRALYTDTVAKTVMPAMGAAVNRLWGLVTPAQRARMRTLLMKGASMTAARINEMAKMLPDKPTAAHLKMLDKELDDMERMLAMRGSAPTRKPMPIGAPPRLTVSPPRQKIGIHPMPNMTGPPRVMAAAPVGGVIQASAGWK